MFWITWLPLCSSNFLSTSLCLRKVPYTLQAIFQFLVVRIWSITLDLAWKIAMKMMKMFVLNWINNISISICFVIQLSLQTSNYHFRYLLLFPQLLKWTFSKSNPPNSYLAQILVLEENLVNHELAETQKLHPKLPNLLLETKIH